jgi:Lrp/AsnC family leucine-responsive transcriptional regulator
VILDKLDQSILAEIQKDGCLSNLELADKVGLSPSPCSRRVKQLEDEGIIAGYATLLAPKKLGLKLHVMIQISMDKHTPDRFDCFEKELETYPEVISCMLFTGHTADYIIELLVEDMESYQALLLNRLTRIPGVSGVQSSFVLRKVIDRTSIPLNHLK